MSRSSVFISFKTDPDLSKATQVKGELERHGLVVTALQGGLQCPYGDAEPRKAKRWLREVLSRKVADSEAVLVVCSAVALQSQWVYLEYSVAMEKTRAVFLLWIDGVDPTSYFVPAPTWLTRRLPACPVYLVDCRQDLAPTLQRMAEVLKDMPAEQRRLRFKQAFALLILIGVSLAPVLVPVAATDAVERARIIGNMKGAIVDGWMPVVAALALLLFPLQYRAPHRFVASGVLSTISGGTGFLRWMGWIYAGFLVFGGLQLGTTPLVFLAAALVFLNKQLRGILTARALKGLDRTRMPVGVGPA